MRFVHFALLGIFVVLVLYFFWGGRDDDGTEGRDGQED